MLCLWKSSKVLLALLVIAMTIGWTSVAFATTSNSIGPVIAQTDTNTDMVIGVLLDLSDTSEGYATGDPTEAFFLSNSIDGVLSVQRHKILDTMDSLLAGNALYNYETTRAMPATQKLLFQITRDSQITERALSSTSELRQSLAGAVGGHYSVMGDVMAISTTLPTLAMALGQEYLTVKIMVATSIFTEAKGGAVFHQSTKPVVIGFPFNLT